MLVASTFRRWRIALAALAFGGFDLVAEAQLPVKVVRDPYGTPHVLAQTDEGAYFGAGYAVAQDRYFQMSWRRLMYLGTTAEYFGRPVDSSGEASDVWVNNDRKARIFGYARHAASVVANLDPATRLLLEAYVDGVNQGRPADASQGHPLFTTYGIPVSDWTLEDVIGVWVQFGTHFQAGGLSEAKNLHKLQGLITNQGMTRQQAAADMTRDVFCHDYAAVVLQADVPLATEQAMQLYATTHGLSNEENCPAGTGDFHFSHAWAVAGSHTTEGSAALVGNPRINVSAPNALYEWSMKGSSFNVTGAGVPGCPNMFVGHASAVAWSPTALGTDQADLFFLTTDPTEHPGEYLLDGVWTSYAVNKSELIKVLGEPDIPVSYKETVWGPVVTALTNDVVADEEYARHMVPFTDPTQNSVAGFVEMYRANDVDELFAASEGWHYPSANLVMADASGDIGYTVVGDIPVRHPALILGGFIATNGSITDYEWIDILPHDLRPHVLRPAAGRLLSANHMPVGSWYPIPVRFGVGSHGETIRSRRLREMMESQASFDVADVFAMHHDVTNAARRDFVKLAIWLRDNQGTQFADTVAVAAVNHLEPWLLQGATMDNSHSATVLASRIKTQFRRVTSFFPNSGCPNISLAELVDEFGGGSSGLISFQREKLWQIQQPVPVDLSDAEVQYIEEVMRCAMLSVDADVPSPTDWQAWYQSKVLEKKRPTWTALESGITLDPFTTINASLPVTDANTILSSAGQSFTQLIRLDSVDGGQSVLPPGASEGPGAGMTGQQDLWEDEMFKSAPLTPLGIRNAGVVSRVILSY